MMWRVDAAVRADATVHCWPDTDLIEHDFTGHCVCIPDLEEQDNGRVLVTHHSLDGRELTE